MPQHEKLSSLLIASFTLPCPAAMTDAAPQAAVETNPQSTIIAKKFETESEHSVSAAPLSHLLGARKHGFLRRLLACLRSYLRSPTAGAPHSGQPRGAPHSGRGRQGAL